MLCVPAPCVIGINALTTTWKRIIDDVGKPVVVTTKEMPPAPKEEELPSCYWTSYELEPKRLRVAQMFNHGWWRFAVGRQQSVAVGSWRLVAGCGWSLWAVVNGVP